MEPKGASRLATMWREKWASRAGKREQRESEEIKRRLETEARRPGRSCWARK